MIAHSGLSGLVNTWQKGTYSLTSKSSFLAAAAFIFAGSMASATMLNIIAKNVTGAGSFSVTRVCANIHDGPFDPFDVGGPVTTARAYQLIAAAGNFSGTFTLVLFGCGAAVLPGVAIGLTLVVIHLVGINMTGLLVYPARPIGSALFSGATARGQLWLLIVARLSVLRERVVCSTRVF